MTIRVVQITDIHLTAKPGTELYGVDTAQSLENIIEAIKKLPVKPDVIITTGDIAEDGSKSAYSRFQDLVAGLNIPVYVLPGNHDDISNMGSSFKTEGFHCTAAMRLKNWGFVFVNSQVEGHSHGDVGLDELAEMEKSISELSGLPILVSLHHSPSNMCPSSGCQLKNAAEFTAALNQHPNVKGVIAGHTHNAYEINAGGHTQFTTPSTFAHATHAQPGASVDHEDFWSSHSLDGSLQGFRILDLFPDGVIRSEVCWIDSETQS